MKRGVSEGSVARAQTLNLERCFPKFVFGHFFCFHLWNKVFKLMMNLKQSLVMQVISFVRGRVRGGSRRASLAKENSLRRNVTSWRPHNSTDVSLPAPFRPW